MDWQQTISLIIVAGAAGALVWSRFGRRRPGVACYTHCGCDGVRQAAESSIVFRARKGGERELVTRMK